MSFAWWHVLIMLIPMLPTFWSIYDIWHSVFPTPDARIFWLVFVVFVPVIGGIIYIFTGRRKATRRLRER